MSPAPLRVHVLDDPEPWALDYLRTLVRPNVTITSGGEVPDDARYDILIGGVPAEGHLSSRPGLKALIIPWSGLPRATRALLEARPGIAVHNIHHNAGAAAEMAVALFLAAAKRIVPADRALRRGDWSPRHEPMPSLAVEGRRALVLGYGAIGRRVARMCLGLGMRVAAVRRRETEEDPGDVPVHTVDALHDLLPETDALFVALPLTDRTEGLIGERELGLLPDAAVLVNVARGPIVDERALFDGLRRGRPAAAGLDVWYSYPRTESDRSGTMPSMLPFHELDNVVLSPHRAGALGMEQTERLRMEALAASINAAATGRSIPFPVSLEEGY